MSNPFASAMSTYTPWPFATRKRAEIRLAEMALELAKADRRGAQLIYGALAFQPMAPLSKEGIQVILDGAGFTGAEIAAEIHAIENPPS